MFLSKSVSLVTKTAPNAKAIIGCYQRHHWIALDATRFKTIPREGRISSQLLHKKYFSTIKLTTVRVESDEINTTQFSEISQSDKSLVIQAANDEEDSLSNNNNDAFSSVAGTEKGRKKLVMVYTCNVCETRSAKKFSEQAYRNGVVLFRCPNCKSLHLIADNLRIFEDERWDIETYLKENDGKVEVVNDENVIEFLNKHT